MSCPRRQTSSSGRSPNCDRRSSLRVLWPMVSHGVLYPSRCTQWLWPRDVGTAYPLAKGGYRVRRESDKSVLGEVDTVEEAYELIADDDQREGGVTDYDLPAAPDERMPLLVRRCLAYVCACLRKAQEEFGETQVKAYVSLSFADTEEALLTSNVTFCTPLPDIRPYNPDLEAVTDAAVGEISLEDCSAWS
ncbi:DUF6193 family natural product biosynthesis protein [Streptomyces sp. NPDC026589]|uniref:DUF6193 family natural product biosynthesis protein n=1 Tax=Streptomyces sp. NPDC026589 TaxID=3155609 RepID=UPI0033FDF89F